MLGLQVAAPLHLVVELVVVLAEDLHSLGIGDAAEVGVGHVAQTFHQTLVHEGVEECHLIGALVHDVVDDILDHVLGQVHVVFQIGESDLGLDHPELGGVALGVGVLGAEGGAEGVHTAEGHGEVLAVELAGHGQAGLLAEEVLRPVHGAILQTGRIVHIQRGHLEHLTGTLAVGGGDDGGVDVDKATVLEEAVDGVCGGGANAEGCGKQVGAGTQVLNGAHIFYGVALLLQGIIGGGDALHLNGNGLDFQRLLGLGSQDDLALDDQGGAHVLAGDFLVIAQDISVQDDLQVLEAGAVVKLDKAEGLHVTDGTSPAHDGDGLPAEGLLIGKNACDLCAFHWNTSSHKQIEFINLYIIAEILNFTRGEMQSRFPLC